jgi:ACS family hexuronate transporter-like MFS transporter
MTQDSSLSSKTRWTIVGLLFASIAINLVDRQVFAVLAPLLRELYGWSNTEYALAGTAFGLGMMIGQVPAGQFLDRVGTRIGLATIFIGWSLLTAAHALAGPGTVIDTVFGGIVRLVPGVTAVSAGLAGFIFLRFVLGLFQCGNYTAGIKALAGLFPAESRSKAGGLFNAGAQFGSVVAGPLILSLFVATLGFSWQMAFVVPALVGLLWLLPWLRIFPSKETMAATAIRPAASAAAPVGPAPDLTLGQLFGNSKVLGLALIRVFTGPVTWFYWNFVALYLRSSPDEGGRGMAFLAVGLFAAIPNMFGMTGNILGGAITDKLVKMTGSVDTGRKLGFTGAFLLGSLSMVLPFVGSDFLAVLLMGLALFGNQWVAATYIGTVGDVVPQQLAGRVNGIAGLADGAASMAATLVAGMVADAYGWTPVFFGFGIFPFLAMASLFLVLRKIEPAQFRAA